MKYITLIILASMATACVSNSKKTEPLPDALQNQADLQPYYDSDFVPSVPQAAMLETAPQHVIALLPRRQYVVVTVTNYPPAKPALDLSKFLTPPKPGVSQPPKEVELEKKPEPVQYILYFEHDKSTLKKGEIEKLEKILANTPKSARISISSHADQDGTEKYNQKLSEKRSASVKSKFSKAGFGNIETHAFGETELADTANTKKAKAKNRRSEIEVNQ
jgi:outer membrane protein OmpA-like peptidoglycan-associated protein